LQQLYELVYCNNPIEGEPLAKYFMLYYIPSLQVINGRVVNLQEKEKARVRITVFPNSRNCAVRLKLNKLFEFRKKIQKTFNDERYSNYIPARENKN
jgi:hypothetical protein